MEKCANIERCFLKLVSLMITSKIPEDARFAYIRHAVQVLEERGMDFMSTEAAYACLIVSLQSSALCPLVYSLILK